MNERNIRSTVGPYSIEGQLGQGGMGTVYSARHHDTGETVALKLVRSNQRELVESIRREITALAHLDHPGIIHILEQGITEDGCPWYSMPIVRGETLRSWIDRSWSGTRKRLTTTSTDGWWTASLSSPFTQRAATGDRLLGRPGDSVQMDQFKSFLDCNQEILVQMCFLGETLAYLHGQGMVHRDLKPENIMLGEAGRSVLMDFGLTRQLTGDMSRETLDIERDISGSVHYLAPELIKVLYCDPTMAWSDIDARSDIYAFGCVLFEVLTGSPPFTGSRVDAILDDHLSSSPPLLSTRVRHAPKALESLLGKLLSKEPSKRIVFARDISRNLRGRSMCNLPLHPLHDRLPEPKSYLYRSACVGRDHIRDCIVNQLLKSDREGRQKQRLILLGGESGSGKTRILKTVGSLARTARVDVLLGEADENKVAPLHIFQKPLQEIVDFCRDSETETRRKIGTNGQFCEVIRPFLATLTGTEDADKKVIPQLKDPFAFFRILIDVFERYADKGRLVVLLDDLHWADPQTIDFFTYYLGRETPSESHLCFVGAYRVEEVGSHLDKLLNGKEVRIMKVERMSNLTMRRMVAEMLGLKSVPRELSNYIATVSEGLPLYITEFMTMLVDEGILKRRSSGKWYLEEKETGRITQRDMEQLALPKSINGLVSRRLSRLDQRAVCLAQAASVLGGTLDLDLLRDMFPEDEEQFHTALTALLNHSFLNRDRTGLHFLHDLQRKSIYQELTEESRKEWHGKVARLMEHRYPGRLEQNAGTLGYHWERAGYHDKAREYYKKAAEEELQRNKNNFYQTMIWYSRAAATIEINPDNERTATSEKAKLLYQAGAYGFYSGEYERSLPLFLESWRLYQKSERLFSIEDSNKSMSQKYLGLKSLQGQGVLFYKLRMAEKAVACFEKICSEFSKLQGKVPLKPADPATNYENLGLALNIRGKKGDRTRAIFLLERARDILTQIHLDDKSRLPKLLTNLSVCYFNSYNYKKSLELLWEAERIFRASDQDDTLLYGDLLNNIGTNLLVMGRKKQALEITLRGLVIKSRNTTENHPNLASAHHNLAAIYMANWDIENAMKHIRKSLGIKKLKYPDNNPEIASTLSDMGVIMAYQGIRKMKEGLTLADRALRILSDNNIERDHNLPIMYRNRGLIYFLMGFFSNAIDDFRYGLRIHNNRGFPLMVAELKGLISLSLAMQGNVGDSLKTALQILEYMHCVKCFEPRGLTLLAIARSLSQTATRGPKTIAAITEHTSIAPKPEAYFEKAISWARRNRHLHARISSMYTYGQFLRDQVDKSAQMRGIRLCASAGKLANKYKLRGILANL